MNIWFQFYISANRNWYTMKLLLKETLGYPGWIALFCFLFKFVCWVALRFIYFYFMDNIEYLKKVITLRVSPSSRLKSSNWNEWSWREAALGTFCLKEIFSSLRKIYHPNKCTVPLQWFDMDIMKVVLNRKKLVFITTNIVNDFINVLNLRMNCYTSRVLLLRQVGRLHDRKELPK